ncbi:MAG: hypothetical protein H6935_03485 [Thiobacillus sp.]|nr:hypothetical protein [Thiobacillus sp.]
MMQTIKIDDEVFSFLQTHAKPFVDTPNATLRRLLGLNSSPLTARATTDKSSGELDLDQLLTESMELYNSRKKAPKTNLEALIQHGLVKEGETVFLVDYQGQKQDGLEATVTRNRLKYQDKFYSMSNLAKKLLLKLGYKSTDVRGPTHWVNHDGISIWDLWQQIQPSPEKKE